MKIFKRLIVVLLTITLIFVFVACTPAEEESTETTEESTEAITTEITMQYLTSEVAETSMAEIEVVGIEEGDSAGEAATVLELSIKNTSGDILAVDPSVFYIEDTSTEDNITWDLFTTSAPFISDLNLMPGAVVTSKIGFAVAPEDAQQLLIIDSFDFFGSDYVGIDLTGEPATDPLTAELTDMDGQIASPSGIGEACEVIPGEMKVTVDSWENVESSADYAPELDGYTQIKVDYTFENLTSEEVTPFLSLAVLDESTGWIVEQGTMPIMDDELWIYDLPASGTLNGFMCYEVTPDSDYSVLMKDSLEDGYSYIVPLD
jgi:uncharacterized lipoprotein YehR (DUF1307 family)